MNPEYDLKDYKFPNIKSKSLAKVNHFLWRFFQKQILFSSIYCSKSWFMPPKKDLMLPKLWFISILTNSDHKKTIWNSFNIMDFLTFSTLLQVYFYWLRINERKWTSLWPISSLMVFEKSLNLLRWLINWKEQHPKVLLWLTFKTSFMHFEIQS